MKTYIDAIDSAASLDELCDALNAFEEHVKELNSEGGEFYRTSDYVDYCDLKLFSEIHPADTCEIFSYDDERLITQNTCTGDKWVIVERTEEFGF